MHTQSHHHGHHHGCGSQGGGPEIFYGYCHESQRMRMMNYNDFMSNVQTGVSNMLQAPASAMQPMMSAITGTGATGMAPAAHHHRHGCGCRDCRDCRDCGHDCGCGCDCSCDCCIHCADVVEYARCGEVRRIPITFDNETRRERNVKLKLGPFATECGQEAGWKAELSETEFKLPPCGDKTIVLSVEVNCSEFDKRSGDDRRPHGCVESCKVLYATLHAEGCTICPLVIAVAVLPDHCGAHQAGCGCGCCCN